MDVAADRDHLLVRLQHAAPRRDDPPVDHAAGARRLRRRARPAGRPTAAARRTIISRTARATWPQRTVGRFNDAAEKDGRGTVVTWCPSCHMHMSDIMSPGNAARVRDRAHHRAACRPSRSPRAAAAGRREAARVAASASGLCHARGRQRPRRGAACRAFQACSSCRARRIPGTCAARLPPCPARLPRPRARPGLRPRAEQLRHGLHHLPLLPPRAGRRSTARTAFGVRNWVHLVAEAMGLEASDAYLGWRTGGAPDIAAIERADESRYHQLVEPELRKPPPL